MSEQKQDTQLDAATGPENVANDNAQVDLQIGVMHGDAYFYHTREDTPEEKYRVGRNYLDSGAQRQAERMISEAFMGGHRTAEVAYYWSLAILSGRSFDHLEASDLHCLNSAFRASSVGADRAWCDALDVVARLVRCLYKHDNGDERHATEFSAEFTDVLAEFGKLPDRRRAEIDRHLDTILAGGIQDRLDAQQTEAVAANRLGSQRRRRAWKFFEPDPHPPVRRTPASIDIGTGDRIRVVLGGLVTATGLTLLVSVVIAGEPVSTCVPLMLAGLTGSWTVRIHWRELHRVRRLRARRAARVAVAAGGGRSDADGQEHADNLRELVELEFGFFRPLWTVDAKDWDANVAGIRNSLCRELIDTYGPDTPIQNIAWLVRWYARQTFNAWQADELVDFREGLRKPPHVRLLFAVAAMSAGIGACVELAISFRLDWSVSLAATAMLVVGGVILLPGWTAIHLERRRFFDDSKEFSTRYDEHERAYRQTAHTLRDRPDDSEMTRWLEYDKAYVKMLAMQEYRLTNRDVFAFATMTEARSRCRRARVLHGPPRYSIYLLRIFLLTTSGVRQISVELNFMTGEIRNENRMTFRYAAIASAWIAEVGVRIDASPHDNTAELDSDDPTTMYTVVGQASKGRALVMSRAFKLSLVNNQLIRVNVETFDRGMINFRYENPWKLAELALDVSGITAALRFLEAVAADGKDWVARESRRRARRMNSLFGPQDAEGSIPSRRPSPSQQTTSHELGSFRAAALSG